MFHKTNYEEKKKKNSGKNLLQGRPVMFSNVYQAYFFTSASCQNSQIKYVQPYITHKSRRPLKKSDPLLANPLWNILMKRENI